MIGRRVISMQKKIVEADFGAGKTLSITIRGAGMTTGMVYSDLRLIVDGEAKTLQELVLAGKINPTVLIYTCTSSTSYLMKSPLNLYTGGSTVSSNFADVVIIVGLKTGLTYSGVQLTASKAANKTYDGMDLYLWNGAVSTTLSGNLGAIDLRNQQSSAHTLSNVASSLEAEMGAIPKPTGTAKYYDGNSLVRINYPNDALDAGFAETAFLLYRQDGMCTFVGVYDYLYASIHPRIWILSGENQYSFISNLYFE